MALLACDEQRSGAIVICLVHAGSCGEEQLSHLRVSVLACDQQRSGAIVHCLVHAGTSRHQQLNHLRVAGLTAYQQSCPAPFVCLVDVVDPSPVDEPRDLTVSPIRCQCQERQHGHSLRARPRRARLAGGCLLAVLAWHRRQGGKGLRNTSTQHTSTQCRSEMVHPQPSRTQCLLYY